MNSTPAAGYLLPEELLHGMRTATDPRLTWYGPDSERVELSGRVLDNWVAKSANFLTEELDAGAGTIVRLELPPHWRSLVWALAVWQTGGVVEIGTAASQAEVIAAADAAAAAHAGPRALVAAVGLGALQPRYAGELPPGAVDYTAMVRSHGDVFFAETLDPRAPALLTNDGSLAYAEVFGVAAAAPERLLINAADPLPRVLTAALRIWANGGSVVLVHPEVDVTDRLMTSERITGRL